MAKDKGENKKDQIYGGAFNFDSLFKDFYSDKNKTDEQKIMKSAFQGNMVQSALNAQIATGMAQTQAAIGKDSMKTAADLEKRNTLDVMKQEFKYGTENQANEFELQNKFADNEYGRDLGMLAATGEEERKNITAKGLQERLSTITTGEQERLNIGARGDEERKTVVTEGEQSRLTDTNRITTEGTEQRSTDSNRITTEGSEQRSTDSNRITTEGSEQRATDSNRIDTEGENQRKTDTNRITTEGSEQRQTDTNRINTEGDNQRKTDTNRITTEGTEQRATDTNRITTEGDETRKTKGFEDDLAAKKANRQSARSRSLARAF